MKAILLIALLMPTLSFGKFILPKSFHADLEQIHKSTLTGRVKKIKGSLDYAFPRRMRFELKGNNASLLVSNDEKTWYYVPPMFKGESGQVTITQTKSSGLALFFDALKYGLKDNLLFKVAKRTKTSVDLTFTQKYIKRLSIKAAKLNFQKSISFENLSEIVITRPDAKKLTLRMISLKPVKKIESKLFTFEIPANTKVNN